MKDGVRSESTGKKNAVIANQWNLWCGNPLQVTEYFPAKRKGSPC